MIKTSDCPKRHDFNVKLRYASRMGMTVCIAVACQEEGEPRIVLCSDTRLEYGEWGSTNSAVKLDVLGYGWIAQMAGDWSSVRELCSILKKKIQALNKPKLGQIAEACQLSMDEVLLSPLFDVEKGSLLLVTGFENGLPKILEASLYEGKPKLIFKDSFGAIGWGGTIASVLLSLREHNIGIPLPYAAYLAYEAKRASEKTGAVGAITTLMIQAPPAWNDEQRVWVKIFSEQGKANLESLYRTLWKVPLMEFPDFTDDCFINLKGR
jgi:hypothetical protein